MTSYFSLTQWNRPSLLVATPRLPFGTCEFRNISEMSSTRSGWPEWGCVYCRWQHCIWFRRQTIKHQETRIWIWNFYYNNTKWEKWNWTKKKNSSQVISNQLHGASCNSWWPITRPDQTLLKLMQSPSCNHSLQWKEYSDWITWQGFCHNYSLSEPIQQLMCKDVPWTWFCVHDAAFTEMKQLATKAPVLSFYDPNAPLVIQCDTNSKGFCAALLQQGKPVIYASRALTETEQRYGQIAKRNACNSILIVEISPIHLW